MKKALVFTLTGLAIIGLCLLAGVSVRFSVRPPEALFRHASEEERPMDQELALPSSAPAPAPARAEKRELARKSGSLKVLGAVGEGASVTGAMGSDEAFGIGGLGLKGVGAGGGGVGVEAKAAEAPAVTRAWFPETFLFEPLITTDSRGHADVPVKVPDRLTSWRVLALAHSRQGGQAGAVASFLGTLPIYVEPVTPAFLYAGDEVRLPIQVVNTTEHEVTAPLLVSATGASLAAVGGALHIPAGGDLVQYATLSTRVPGTAVVHASLGSTDAVDKSIPVQPAGLRHVLSKGGTLAAPRSFSLEGPPDTLPGTESIRLRVFPGALGLLRAELSAAPGRGGVAEDAYLLSLLGQAPALLRALGAEPDEATIRELTLLATQRVMRHARAPSSEAAALLAEGALAHPDNPVLARTGERLAAQVARSQRPDGTCEAQTGWTLQRLLVATADCVSAVRLSTATPSARQRATAVTVKASGAFERNANRITDGYTAAAVLASGAVTGSVADTLRTLVGAHLKQADDGSRFLEVSPGVVRADGRVPSTHEATALAVLALETDPAVADLGTWLMSGYSASWGWGDGRANLLALRASLQLFKAAVPSGVKVTLERDGRVLAEHLMDAAALRDVLTVDAPAEGSSGRHQWTVKAEPAVPGLGYSFQLVAFTPWKAPEGAGLSLTVALPPELKADHVAEVTLTAAMPGNSPMVLTLPLAAGVQADTPSLEGLVTTGRVTRYETQDGQVTLHLPPQSPGAVYAATLRVVPTLAGKLQAGPSTLAPEDDPRQAKSFAPTTWVVTPER